MANLSGVNKYFSVAKEGFATTTSAPVASGATTVQLSSVAGYTNGDIVVLVIDAGDIAKKQVFTGIVDTSGTQITNVVWTEGANTSHIIGAPVIDYVTASHQSMTTKGLLVSHDQDGTLKAGAVDNAAVLASNVVETSKIKDANVTPIKLSTSPIGFGLQEIARTTLSTASDTITVSSIPAKNHIKILIGYIASGGTADASFRINNLSSAIYRMTYNVSPAISPGTDTGAVTSLPVESGVVASGVKGYCVIDMWNASGGRRIGNMVTVSDTTSVLAWLRGSFIIDTTSQMTRFDLINAGTGDFASGSEIIILGTD